MTREEIDEELEKAQLTTNSDKTYEALSIARAMVKAHINYETIAKVCVDNALRAATIEIAGEDEMPFMEFLNKVSSGDFLIIRKQDMEIKPIPYEGEEEIKRAYDRGYNQACKDKIDAPYKEAEWLPQYEGKWVVDEEAKDAESKEAEHGTN